MSPEAGLAQEELILRNGLEVAIAPVTPADELPSSSWRAAQARFGR